MVQATTNILSTTITALNIGVTNSGSTTVGGPLVDHNWLLLAHALLTILGYVLLMPIGALILSLLGGVRWHWLNQVLASGLAILGAGVGIYLSTLYNNLSRFNSSHQIVGLLVSAAVVTQVLLGWWHHRVYKQTQHPTQYGVVHRYFGWVVIIVATANGALGFNLASYVMYTVPYVVAAYIFVAVTAGTVIWARFRKNFRTKRRASRSPDHDSSYSLVRLQQPSPIPIDETAVSV
jgi:hypothetical protein